MQIESLSKRLDRYLYCKAKIDHVEPTLDNYWKVVKRVPMKTWKNLSAAQVTIQVIDPMIKAIADTLNEWEEAAFDRLPVEMEDDAVACFLCVDGTVPIRLLICPTPDEEEVVIVIDLLAKRLTTPTP